MSARPDRDLYSPLRRSAALLVLVFAIGAVGYAIIGWPEHGPLDAVYMTVITLTTVGYGEVIDLSEDPGGRVFTVLLLFGGVGAFLNFVSSLTAFWVEGQHLNVMWRKRMKRAVSGMRNHVIVCGAGNTGAHIARELIDTAHAFVVIEQDEQRALGLADRVGRQVPIVLGDATDDATLEEAGIGHASELVACVSNDKDNLIVTFSARLLRPDLRIVCRCVDEDIAPKMRQAGADSVVIPSRIGAMRLISEAVRPTAVDYLDRMLRDRDAGLRVESTEVEAGARLEGRTVGDLRDRDIDGLQLLAVRGPGGAWHDDPGPAVALAAGDALIYTGGPSVRLAVERLAAGKGSEG